MFGTRVLLPGQRQVAFFHVCLGCMAGRQVHGSAESQSRRDVGYVAGAGGSHRHTCVGSTLASNLRDCTCMQHGLHGRAEVLMQLHGLLGGLGVWLLHV